MKKILTMMVVALFLFSITAFAKDGSDDSSSISSSSSSVETSSDNSADGSTDDIVNGVKVKGDGTIDDDQTPDNSLDDSSDDFVNGTKLRGDGTIDDDQKEFRSRTMGLENAILRVRKNETREHLEEVLEKIQEKRKEQLAKLEKMTVEKDDNTNTTVIKGKGRAKFLGFISTDKFYEYEVDKDGNVKKHGKFFDFMFKKEDPLDSN